MYIKYNLSLEDYSEMSLGIVDKIKKKYDPKHILSKIQHSDFIFNYGWSIAIIAMAFIFLGPNYDRWYIYLIFIIIAIVVAFNHEDVNKMYSKHVLRNLLKEDPFAYKEKNINIDEKGLSIEGNEVAKFFVWSDLSAVFYDEKYMCIFFKGINEVNISLYKIDYEADTLISEFQKYSNKFMITKY
ncbi:MAG: hypothetical protein RR515_04010 [Clostridium sp.]